MACRSRQSSAEGKIVCVVDGQHIAHVKTAQPPLRVQIIDFLYSVATRGYVAGFDIAVALRNQLGERVGSAYLQTGREPSLEREEQGVVPRLRFGFRQSDSLKCRVDFLDILWIFVGN